MDEKPTLLEYLSQIFMIFGIVIFLLNIFCLIFGESAREFSTIFSNGKNGISVETSMQFLLVSAVTVTMRYAFMTDILIKKMPASARIISMFISIIIIIIAMIILFGWFPADNVTAWLCFGISLIISCSMSVVISLLNEKSKNKKLDTALKNAKENL